MGGQSNLNRYAYVENACLHEPFRQGWHFGTQAPYCMTVYPGLKKVSLFLILDQKT
jgi:hypothetical protein